MFDVLSLPFYREGNLPKGGSNLNYQEGVN
jgi:hypothetical protein